ncbi:phosphatidylinositol N-acetylglucosaminyltransferase subunit Y-domain-containing protein [Radiomyces spectabilis]|uniref:phosphatidylinositol N-acetylglucosaminyltransferase subunit Y-domain-containing protein n=1 Tax=Radiomyces spectabilis TaxID=64574 RepID=UPI002220C850|nr:phosphatidylinositol N-acetylglucosaminyltransferase subunit Y-domain-containing protein [Radiomyces spectabilis]KAI8388106.1 phosphatidylinositol N-acetylglucosaminyltransferase subunit Y-domain-containing protein [Radiomyces spectabilis]
MQSHRRRPSKSILFPRTAASGGLAAQPLHARRLAGHTSETIPDTTYLWGYALLLMTFLMFMTTMYALVGSQYVPDTNNKILDWIKHDQYYCLLVPITAIVWIYFVVWNWMGMKFFRHN